MPYKDPEKRRQYNTRYKQRMRKAQAKIHPLRGVRIYFCQRYPGLHVSGAGTFFDSFLISKDREVQWMVEAHPMFGEHIFCLALNLDLFSEDE